ncbi:imidazole glycerol phosphate synthase subunit HisH [Alphaproteobacteria bacterium]|nr:imidazole glycerol phosphate synthase subunit HisH [Alphaproteobacteria bacterium]
MMKKIAVIDYGAGNIGSIINALNFLEIPFGVVSEPSVLSNYDALILPGVGAFGPAMNRLIDRGFVDKLEEEVLYKKKNILGICLGFQLLCASSNEGGMNNGLGFINAKVSRFTKEELLEKKKTHIGFNAVKIKNRVGIFLGLNETSDFYFVHSYRILPKNLGGNILICNYGVDFLAGYQQRNITGVQFHPEKSQANGLRILHNFSSL